MTRPRAAAAGALMLMSLAAVAGCGGAEPASRAAAPGSALQQQFVDVVDRVSPQVVQIRSARGLGSGIVFDNRGDIVTNAHVTTGSTRFAVTRSDGKQHAATLVGSDPSNDLAVVRISGTPQSPATFADSSAVHSGDLVLAIGNPLGLQSSVTQGVVSSVDRSVSEGTGVTLSHVIQTSAEINPGNSGGALVDLSGRVIGIPTLSALDPDLGGAQAPGIGFAISSSAVRQVANRLIAGG
jgi:putative serine protease PepD